MNAPIWSRTASSVVCAVFVALLGGCRREPAPISAPTDVIIADQPTRTEEAKPNWEECTVRVRSARFADEWEEQDAWLETTQRLEDFLKREPMHAGALRELSAAYLHLLSLESAGEPLCLQAGRRISELETRANASDRAFIDEARQLLFARMQLYPCVCDIGKRSGKTPKSVAALGQDRFEEVEGFRVDTLRVKVYRNAGQPPDPELLWGDIYFIISKSESPVPENTVGYVVALQRGRYYLCFRGAQESYIVSLLGPQPPTVNEMRIWIEKTLRASLSQGETPS